MLIMLKTVKILTNINEKLVKKKNLENKWFISSTCVSATRLKEHAYRTSTSTLQSILPDMAMKSVI